MAVDRAELVKSYFLLDSTSAYRYSLEDTWGFNGHSWTENATYYIHDANGDYLFKNFGLWIFSSVSGAFIAALWNFLFNSIITWKTK